MFQKGNRRKTIVLEYTHHPSNLYCFIEYGNSKTEYELQPAEYVDDLCKQIMKRETHGEDIVDVLEDIGFEKL